MGEIKRMATLTHNALMWSVEDMLMEAYKQHSSAKKAIVLVLDDQNGRYNVSYLQSGMKAFEIVTLLSTGQQIFLNHLIEK